MRLNLIEEEKSAVPPAGCGERRWANERSDVSSEVGKRLDHALFFRVVVGYDFTPKLGHVERVLGVVVAATGAALGYYQQFDRYVMIPCQVSGFAQNNLRQCLDHYSRATLALLTNSTQSQP